MSVLGAVATGSSTLFDVSGPLYRCDNTTGYRHSRLLIRSLPLPVLTHRPATNTPGSSAANSTSNSIEAAGTAPAVSSFVHAAFQNRLQTETALEQVPESESAATERVTATGDH